MTRIGNAFAVLMLAGLGIVNSAQVQTAQFCISIAALGGGFNFGSTGGLTGLAVDASGNVNVAGANVPKH